MMPSMLSRPSIAVLALLTISLGACDNDKAPPSPSGGSGGDVQISGNERLGWMQQAANASELATFQYAIYVDGVRSELTGASCATTAGTSGFECTAPLPVMSPGTHTLELAAFVVDGGVLESAKSPALTVVKRALTLSTGLAIDPQVVTSDHVRLNLQLVTEGLERPTDLVFTPDGAILVAERGGIVRVVRDGILMPDAALDRSSEGFPPEGGLLALTLDSRFEENGFAYTLSASNGRSGLVFTLERYRSVRDRFGDRAVLVDRIPASSRGARGTIRFGPDGKIYVALDDAANLRSAGNLGSYNGKVLRLNTDATTPTDQVGFSPIYSLDHPAPRGMAWQASTGNMWVVDTLDQSSGRVTVVALSSSKEKRGTTRQQYALPPGTGPASAAFYQGSRIPVFRGNFFIAAEEGRHLIRIQPDPNNPDRVQSAERLLQDQLGPVHAVATGPDEALYIASDTALFRLVP